MAKYKPVRYNVSGEANHIYPLFSFTGNSHGLLETANSLYMIYLLYMNEKNGILMKWA